ncbi:MAG: hypothetical protein R3F11_01905 [Verrucomicrobiales bacterium]
MSQIALKALLCAAAFALGIGGSQWLRSMPAPAFDYGEKWETQRDRVPRSEKVCGTLEEGDGCLHRRPTTWRNTRRLVAAISRAKVCDLPKSIEKIDHLPAGQRALSLALVDLRWSEVDPEGFLARCLEQDRLRVPFAIGQWAKNDPDAALAAVLADERIRSDINVATAFAVVIARHFPGRFQDLALQVESELWRRVMLIEGLPEMAEALPKNAMVLSLGNDGIGFESAIEAWAQSDPAGAVGFLADGELTFDQRRRAIDRVLAATEYRPISEVARLIDELPESDRDYAALRMLRGWEPDGETTDEMALATELALRTSDPRLRQSAIRTVAIQQLSADLQGAFEFVERHGAGFGRVELVEEFIRSPLPVFGRDLPDPNALAEVLQTHLTQLRRRDTIGIFCQEWAQTDPERAAEWAFSLPDLGIVRLGRREAIRGWMWQSREEATAFIRALPPGDERNELLQAFASSDVQENLGGHRDEE